MERGTPVKYLCCDNSFKQQSKLQKVCGKLNMMLYYMTPQMPQFNSVIEIIFSVIKEGVLAILLNKKLNETDQKMIWAESVNT